MPRSDYEVLAGFGEIFGSLPEARWNGEFQEAFYRTASELKPNLSSEVNSQIENLADYLTTNGYAIYAPYYAEHFSNSKSEITISVWDGKDESGVTKGFVELNGEIKEVLVDDDYAYNNPTWVIGPYKIPEDAVSQVTNEAETGGRVQANAIYCESLAPTDVVRILIPEYRLTDNTRPWPWANYLKLWVITGDYVLGSNGQPLPSTHVSQLWNGKHVSRDHAKDKRWLNSDLSYFEYNWEKKEQDLYFIFAHYKNGYNVSVTPQLKIQVSPSGQVSYSYEVTASKVTSSDYKTIVATAIDRCSFLKTYHLNTGSGLRNECSIFSFDKLQFYLKPLIL